MSVVSILSEIRHLFYLYKAMTNRSKRPERTKLWLDKALANKVDPDLRSWVLAADGIHKAKEGRVGEARIAFTECLELSTKSRHDDEEFVSAYCELWLAICDSQVGYKRIKELGLEAQLANEKASRFVRMLLPLVSMERLEEICGDREIDDQPFFRLPENSLVSTVTSNFDF